MQPNYKQSGAYRVKYQACLSRALGMVRAHVTSTLEAATSAATPAPGAAVTGSTADSAFALFYGKFRTQAPKLTNVISAIESRCGNGKSDASETRTDLADTIVQVRYVYITVGDPDQMICIDMREKRRGLGCVNSSPMARGSRDGDGIHATQPSPFISYL